MICILCWLSSRCAGLHLVAGVLVKVPHAFFSCLFKTRWKCPSKSTHTLLISKPLLIRGLLSQSIKEQNSKPLLKSLLNLIKKHLSKRQNDGTSLLGWGGPLSRRAPFSAAGSRLMAPEGHQVPGCSASSRWVCWAGIQRSKKTKKEARQPKVRLGDSLENAKYLFKSFQVLEIQPKLQQGTILNESVFLVSKPTNSPANRLPASKLASMQISSWYPKTLSSMVRTAKRFLGQESWRAGRWERDVDEEVCQYVV